MLSRVPLAWLALTHDKRRLLSSVLGVSLAVLLMFVELGFLNGIYDSMTLPLDKLNADLIMVNRLKDDMNPMKPFPRRRLLQAAEFAGVETVYPLYMERSAVWRTRGAEREEHIRVFAFDPSDPVFLIPEVVESIDRLQLPDTALVDRRSRPSYGVLGTGTLGELQGRRIRLVGEFDLGPDIEVNGTLVMSRRNFLKFMADPRSAAARLEQVEFGLIKLAVGTDRGSVAAAINNGLLDDVDVLTKEQLADRIQGFWRQHQPVGAVFGMGLVVGFIIGVMICYQILFTDIADHLPQFATLKAIGSHNAYLLRVALRQSLYLALIAFAVGLPLTFVAYRLLESVTGLVMWLSLGRISVVLTLTLVMCMTGAVLAMRKVFRADPAEVF